MTKKFQEAMMSASTLVKLFPATMKAIKKAAEKTALEAKKQREYKKVWEEIIDNEKRS